MTTEAPPRLLTADEFFELPDAREGGKMELVCGRVVTHMPVARGHGRLALNLGAALREFVRLHRLREVGVEAGFWLTSKPDTVRAPDVHFVRATRLEEIGADEQRFFSGYPDLAVEVISPHDRSNEINEKLEQYSEAGVPRTWVVYPDTKTVAVHRPDGTARTLHVGDVLTSDDAGFEVEGFALALEGLFA